MEFEAGYENVLWDKKNQDEESYRVIRVVERAPSGRPTKVLIRFLDQVHAFPDGKTYHEERTYGVAYLKRGEVARPLFCPGRLVTSRYYGDAVVTEQLNKAPNPRYRVRWVDYPDETSDVLHCALCTMEFKPASAPRRTVHTEDANVAG